MDDTLSPSIGETPLSKFASKFVSFKHVFTKTSPRMDFNTETSHLQRPDYIKLPGYLDRNAYIDRISIDVFQFCGARMCNFFDTDIYALIRLKQRDFPVMLLTTGKQEANTTDGRRHN